MVSWYHFSSKILYCQSSASETSEEEWVFGTVIEHLTRTGMVQEYDPQHHKNETKDNGIGREQADSSFL